MLSLTQGQYSGQITHSVSLEGIVCTQTTYMEAQLNQVRHFHENMHLSFVLSGDCAEKKKDVYERKPGHFTFYHAGEPHQMIASTGRSVHINVEIESAFLHRHGLHEPDLIFAKHRVADLKFLMLKLRQEMFEADTLSFQTLLLEVLSGTSKAGKSTPWPRWATTADQYLRAHFLNQVTLSDLSAVTGVHPVTISKYFRFYFGCTLGDYIRKHKIEHALALIKSGQSSLTEIAYQCGFADQSHFTRTFKQYLGVRPSAYDQL